MIHPFNLSLYMIHPFNLFIIHTENDEINDKISPLKDPTLEVTKISRNGKK
jgi:hypothetical protein